MTTKFFKVTYDHDKYKPSQYWQIQQQREWSLTIPAANEAAAAETLKTEHKKNPFYFKFELIGSLTI